MLRFALAFVFLVGCSDPPPPPSSIAPPPPSTAMPAAPLPETPTWLYRVQTDMQPSYVFAALEGVPLHASFPSDYFVLFHFARLVIVTDASNDSEAQASAALLGIDRIASLPGVLGPERFARLTDALHGMVDPVIVSHLRPIFALPMLGLALMAEAAGEHGDDARISPTHDAVSRRQMDGGPLLGLFTQDELQAEMRALMPASRGALIAILDHLDDDRAAARETVADYRAGDEDPIASDVARDATGEEAFGALARARDTAGLDAHFDRLQTELRAGNTLAILPIGMVLGEHGVLARLRANGVEITRVAVAAPPQ